MSRKITLSVAALRAGVATIPEGITFLFIPGVMPAPVGEIPHAHYVRSERGCPDELAIALVGGKKDRGDRVLTCTRHRNHRTPHVAHVARGRPVAAWDDEKTSEKGTPEG